ncbi:MAG: hypothetical protein IJ184_02730 [Alphaproteobacteria bacterium]|nr:hypothetical protein [Alphaproteobacteria bacterium]
MENQRFLLEIVELVNRKMYVLGLMREAGLERISRFSKPIEVEDIKNYTMDAIVDDCILPFILQPGGQDIRGWRISDEYMNFIAEWGDYIYSRSELSYNTLCEYAMQRLSLGAVLHDPIKFHDAENFMPRQWQGWGVYYDQYGTMSEACWKFFTANAFHLLKSSVPSVAHHAKMIVFGIIEHSSNDKPAVNYIWGCDEIPFAQVLDQCRRFLTFISWDEVYARINHHNYMLYRDWLRQNWDIVEKDFYKKLKIDGVLKFKARKALKQQLQIKIN